MLMFRTVRLALVTTLTATLALAAPSFAHGPNSAHGHDHAHDDSEKLQAFAKGYFEDKDVVMRPFADWEGNWQSVYPYLQNGTLDAVMEAKAKTGDKTAAEYRAYYETGYKSDITGIDIKGEVVTFHRGKDSVTATYQDDGYEILTYAKGNRGVRFIFKKVSGDAAAPEFMQFSDHIIAPKKADHYHIYLGNDRADLLSEVTHWPTFYPANLSGEEVKAEMLAH